MSDETGSSELKKLKAILRLHQSIGAHMDMEKVCRIAVREFVDVLNCNMCVILLVKGDNLEMLAGMGIPPMPNVIDIDNYAPAIKHIVTTKQEMSYEDVTDVQAADYIPSGWVVSSLICTPIIANEVVKGIIQLGFDEKNAFGHDDLELVHLLANEISVAFERSFLYSQALDLSIKDGLTACFNRRKFDMDIIAEIARAKGDKEQLSLFMIDIDWFKQYNDFHGHPKGDTLLQRVAAVLTSNVRALDTVYRYGGEEFAILLPDTAKTQALQAARRLQLTIEEEEFEGETDSQPGKKLTVSIGLACFPSDADHGEELIKAADLALYKAKQTGRDRICTFERGA